LVAEPRPGTAEAGLGTGPAHRFLHVCYCCDDNAEVTALFVEGLGMRRVMGTPLGSSDGSILGLEGQVVGTTDFVYDFRGPRVSPAVEVQRWVHPAVVGQPPDDPTQAGIQSLGFAVREMASTIERLEGLGCTLVGTSADRSWTTLRDPRGVVLDLVADRTVPEVGRARMRHLRITCTDLEVSRAWYEGIGFTAVQEMSWTSGTPFGLVGPVEARAVALRLPGEAFVALLVQWRQPLSHGRHPPEPNHAGLWRTAIGVDDTRVAHEALVAAGWRFDREPTLVRLEGTPVPDMWIAFLSDPDGVPFELVQRPRSVFLAEG
jgi:catechol 2,3-dioxygenase-like lactoylglutathione lyase family enzyme